MTKPITLLDYKGCPVTVDVEMNDVKYIELTILSGDETMYVKYKDGTGRLFDSSVTRAVSCFDYTYTIFGGEENVNLIEDPDWKTRKSSYDFKHLRNTYWDEFDEF